MKKRFNVALGTLVSIAVASLAYWYLTMLSHRKWFDQQSAIVDVIESLDYRTNDIKQLLAQRTSVSRDVLLVAIDDASLTEVGRWPWSRELVAKLIDNLMSYKVKAVALDIAFSEPESSNPNADKALADVVRKNADRIVLGTFSNHLLKLKPYQDYCANEAFLTTGDSNLVKLNPGFVIDDEGELYDDLVWQPLFKNLFDTIDASVESNFLAQAGKTSPAQLNRFQRNALKAEKSGSLFDYCAEWLAPNDAILMANSSLLEPRYRELFSAKSSLANLAVQQQIQQFQSTVAEFPSPQYGEWETNIPEVQEASKYTGSFIVELDVDGVARRYPLFYRSGNRLGTSFIPSLALETYLAGSGYRADVKIEKTDEVKRIKSFRILDPSTDPERLVQEIPVDRSGRALITYYGPKHTVSYISAKDLFNDSPEINVTVRREKTSGNGPVQLRTIKDLKADLLKDKYIVIGSTAQAVYDLRNTPLDINFPGPEIQATVLSNLVQGKFLHTVNHQETQLPSALIMLGILLSIGIIYLNAAQLIIFFVFSVAAEILFDQILFDQFGVMYSSVFVLLDIVAVFFACGTYKYLVEERGRSQIRSTFSRYVSPAIVDELLSDTEALRLGGKKQDMTVFFSDIRGFTEFSENMDPQELSEFLSNYLTPMTQVIFDYKGTLDKYIGDGVMAFFGAPLPDPDHAFHACECALQSLERLEIFKADFKHRNWPDIKIGIGINSGAMSVGNMGSTIVQNYTVIGDAVNLGARIEGANREYGTRVLISEFTHEQVKDRFVTREIDLVLVKGKTKPVRIFEILSRTGDTKAENFANIHSQALALYRSAQFTAAHAMFVRSLGLFPDDKLTLIYLDRCLILSHRPPPADWDGIFVNYEDQGFGVSI